MYLSYFSLSFSILLVSHCFLPLYFSDITACSMLFPTSCCLFLFLFFLLLVQPTSILSEFFSLLNSLLPAVYLAMSSPLMSITSIPYRTLGRTTLFQYVFLVTIRSSLCIFFFYERVCHRAQSPDLFRHFIFLSFKYISLCLYCNT